MIGLTMAFAGGVVIFFGIFIFHFRKLTKAARGESVIGFSLFDRDDVDEAAFFIGAAFLGIAVCAFFCGLFVATWSVP